MRNRYCVLLGIATLLTIFAVDQASKAYLIAMLPPAGEGAIEITPFFNLVMVWNYGVSFGLFSEHNQPLLLVGLSGIISAILLGWLIKTPSTLVAFALGAVLGGAAGNVADRLRFGAVADFFDFHIATYHWPAFNIADSAIFIGVVLLCIHSMFMEPKQKP